MKRALLAHRVGHLTKNWQQPPRHGPKPHFPLGPNLPGAACKGHDPLFDNHVDKETNQQRDIRHAQAIEICLSCPVLDQCKPGPEDEGIWRGALYERKHRRCPCGAQLPHHATKQQRYCGPKCRQSKHITYQRNCAHCNQPFTTIQPQQRFCHTTCRNKWRGRAENTKPPTHPRPPGLPACQVCGHPITTRAQKLGARNCSLRCRKTAAKHGTATAA